MVVRFRYQYNIPFKNDSLASKSKSCLYHFHQNEPQSLHQLVLKCKSDVPAFLVKILTLRKTCKNLPFEVLILENKKGLGPVADYFLRICTRVEKLSAACRTRTLENLGKL